MPRSGGIYTLPPIYEAEPNTTIRSEQHNVPLRDIADALTNSLPRDGQAGMTGNLPMGGNRITGLAAAVNAGDVPRWDQARNASNLNEGTVPNARLSGNYTGLGELSLTRVFAAPGGTLAYTFSGDGSGSGMHKFGSGGNLALFWGNLARLQINATQILAANGAVFTGDGSGLTDIPLSGIAGTIPVARGGTGATSASAARSNLGANNAGNLTAGVVPSPRISGNYTDFISISGSGALSMGGGNFTVTSGGHTVAANLTSSTGNVGGSGGLNLRPRGGGEPTNQTTIANDGSMSVQGQVSAPSFSGNASASNLNTGTTPIGRYGTSNAFRDWVLARMASATVGAVGTYAAMRVGSGYSGGTLNPGDTISASWLNYTAFNGASQVGSPSGTWRAMGEATPGSGNEDRRSTIFLRVA